MGCGGVVLATIAGKPARQMWATPSRRVTLGLAAGAAAVYPLAFYTGMDLAGVAVGNIVALGTGPLIGAALEWVFDHQRPGRRWWWALGCGVGGAGVLGLSDHSQTSAHGQLFGWGIAAAVIAGGAYGGFSYALGRLMRQGAPPLAATGAVFGGAALPLLVIALVTMPAVSSLGSALGGLAYLVAGPMVVSYLLYARGLLALPASRVLIIALIEPAVATLLAIVVVGERFGVFAGLGLVLIAFAVGLAGRADPMRKEALSA